MGSDSAAGRGESSPGAFSFNGQVVVVTGAGRGLGRAYAIEFARRGALLIVNARGTSVDGSSIAQDIVDEIQAAGGTAFPNRSDVATAEGATALITQAIDISGGIDVVVNNAGFLRPSFVADMTDEQMSAVLDVHVLAAEYITRAAWNTMREQGYGRIVYTGSSSTFGQQGNSNYVAAKAGVLGLMRAYAQEGRDFDFRANAIYPYANSLMGVDNPLVAEDTIPMREMLGHLAERRDPSSVVPLVTYLASRECAVNGEAYSALAGRFARVVYGLTEGWIAEDPYAVTPETIAERLDEIGSEQSITIPMHINDEIRNVLDRLVAQGLIHL